MDNDVGFKRTVATRCRVRPLVHPHFAAATVCGGREVCVVGSGAILNRDDNAIVGSTSFSVVVLLEVECRLTAGLSILAHSIKLISHLCESIAVTDVVNLRSQTT